MSPRDPRLPHHVPLAIAHRGGNSLDVAREALRVGADMLEADIWLHNGRIEVRHMHRLGPVFWERWRLALSWRDPLTLRELLSGTSDDTLLFLDLKGEELDLGPAMVEELGRTAPGRMIAVCGRNYRQLDPLVDHPNIVVFYSVGERKEWPEAWPRLEAMPYPALSLKYQLATPTVAQRLGALGATVVCWGVRTSSELATIVDLGFDGATTSNHDLITRINHGRHNEETS
jgi:glycerophosphoryl diester phosphodiesterase